MSRVGGSVIPVVAICVGFCAVVLFTHLLMLGRIDGKVYAATVAGALVFSFVLWKNDSVQEVNLTELSVKLREAEKIRADVFAKAEAVQRLGEELGELAAWNIRTVNRFVGEEHTRQMVLQRDRLSAMLREIGATEARISEIVRPINEVVVSDLKQDAKEQIVSEINEVNQTRTTKIDWRTLEDEVTLLLTNYDRAALLRALEKRGLEVNRVAARLDVLERFVRTNRL